MIKIRNAIVHEAYRPIEWATVALAQLDAENHYRLRATCGRPEGGLSLLDKLDHTLERRSARKKARG